MATWYLSTYDSDLSGGADFSKEARPYTQTGNSLTVSVANTSTETSYAFSPPNVPNNPDWETGTFEVKVNVTTANTNMFLSIQVDRINSAGTVQESTTATAEQQLTATGVKTFTTASTNWTAGSATDRFRVRYIFRSANSHGGAISVVIATGTTDSSIITSALTESPSGTVGTFVRDLEQWTATHATKIATGGTTTDGVSTNLYLDARVFGYGRGDSLTTKIENRQTGTAFTDAATNTQAIGLVIDPNVPNVRRSHTTIYDSNRNRLILFGGWNGTTRYNDVWELTLDGLYSPQPQWRQLNPTGTPPSARNTHVAFYDATLDRMITGFGSTGSDNNDMYSLSFSGSRDGAWTTLSPGGSIPAVRSQSSICNDHTNKKAYLVCGWGAARLNDIQEFDYSTTNGTWTQKSADGAGGAISRRNDTACVWDSSNSRIVMFGGYDGTNRLNDTWQYVPGTNTWTDKTGVFSGTPPSTRELMYCALDTTNNRMVIYGGRNGTASSDVRNDMAYLTLSAGSETWSVVTPAAGTRPAGMWTNAGAYDPDNQQFLAVAGMDSSLDVTRQAYAIDCSNSGTLTLKQLILNQYLRGRDAVGYAYNPDRDESIMVGGFARVDPTDSTLVNGDHTNDIWIYDHANDNWYLPLRDRDTSFVNREGSNAVYDTNRNRFILFGGLGGNNTTNNTYYNDVWELIADSDGIYRLNQLSPTGTPPTARWLAGAVYDDVNDRLVVFGGDDGSVGFLNDLYSLSFSGGSGGAWTTLSPTGTPPSGRRQMMYAWDSTADAMIISHGATGVSSFVGDTFQCALSGTNGAWTNLSPTGSPPSNRRGMTGTYFLSKDYVIAFGGYNGTTHYSDVYYLDLSGGTANWVALTPATVPQTRRSHFASLTPTGNKMVIGFGREDTAESFGSREGTWSFDISNATPTNWTWTRRDPKIYLNGSVPVTGLTGGGTTWHWQSWVTGSRNNDSAKLSYGGNAESATDFQVGTAGGGVSVNDTVTVTEGVTIRINVTPSVSDTVTVTEGIQISYSLPSPIFDLVTVTEDFSGTVVTNISVSDLVTITENIVLSYSLPTPISDTVTVTDVPTVFITILYLSVDDTVTVTENISLSIPLPVSVSDLVTVTENFASEIAINLLVSDEITVTEAVVLSYSLPTPIFDQVTITENISLSIPLPVSVSDLVTITENVNLVVVTGNSIFDLVTVTEDITLSIPLPVSVNDLVTVTDVPTLLIPILFLSVDDTVTVTENIVLSIPLPVFVSDLMTVTEDFSGVVVTNNSIFDLVTVTEDIVLSIPLPVSVNDTVTVNDSALYPIFEEIEVFEYIQISYSLPTPIFDSVTITENIVLSIPLPVFVYEDVTVTEDIQLSIVGAGNDISVFDLVTVTENIVLSIPLPVAVFDEVTVTENITLSIPLPVSVFDEVTVTENVQLVVVSYISVNDQITVTEDVAFSIPLPVFVFDSITITEDVDIDYDLPTPLFDSVTVTEDVSLSIPLPISVFDEVTVTENISLNLPLPVSVNDLITVTDVPTILIPILFISVDDTVTATENIVLSVPLPVSVNDLMTITEDFASQIPVNLSVSDTVTVTEFIVISYTVPSPLFDLVTITENIVLSIPLPVAANDLITITESVTLVVVTGNAVFELITVTEDISLSIPLPVSVFDEITVTDVPTVFIPTLTLSVFETITVEEFFLSGGQIAFNVNDLITVTDVPTILIPILLLSVVEDVTVQETVIVTIVAEPPLLARPAPTWGLRIIPW